MFSRTAVFIVSSLSILAAANPILPRAQCNTGSAECCNSVTSASDPTTAALLGLLGIVVQGVDVLIGVTCSPISIVGIGAGANCAQQPVCCANNSFGGIVSVGCTPISA